MRTRSLSSASDLLAFIRRHFRSLAFIHLSTRSPWTLPGCVWNQSLVYSYQLFCKFCTLMVTLHLVSRKQDTYHGHVFEGVTECRNVSLRSVGFNHRPPRLYLINPSVCSPCTDLSPIAMHQLICCASVMFQRSSCSVLLLCFLFHITLTRNIPFTWYQAGWTNTHSLRAQLSETQ